MQLVFIVRAPHTIIAACLFTHLQDDARFHMDFGGPEDVTVGDLSPEKAVCCLYEVNPTRTAKVHWVLKD